MRLSEAARLRHPDAPWLWREDWASGRLRSGSATIVIILWVFAISFGGFSIPLLRRLWSLLSLLLSLRDGRPGDEWTLIAALLVFPFVAAAFVVAAVIATARWQRFREVACVAVGRCVCAGRRIAMRVRPNRLAHEDDAAQRLAALLWTEVKGR